MAFTEQCPMHYNYIYSAVPHACECVYMRLHARTYPCMCIHHVYNKVVSKFTITIIAKSILSLRTMYNSQC